MSASYIWIVLFFAVHAFVIIRALTAENREPASRAAWLLALVFLPGAGIVAYILLGETWIPRRLHRKALTVDSKLAGGDFGVPEPVRDTVPERYRPTFRHCERIAEDGIAGGNRADLAADSNEAIDMMIRDFDAARSTIHISFYIWLADGNGLKVLEAVKRAARRGVVCRVIADGIGSRAIIRSHHWADMRRAGAKVCVSMKVHRGLELFLGGRVDLRNHRKIVVVDSSITWCGSQNCADPEFRVKAKYAPWVDIMMRLQGPVVLQNQRLFASDWMVENGEDLTALMTETRTRHAGAQLASKGLTAIAFGTGPMSATGAMSGVFAHLFYCAEHEVVISNPYFVPDPTLLAALTACARRGVRTTLILPARNDSRVVGLISKAYYPHLVEAGVRLFEFRGGLLHAKTVVVDGIVALIGSANMDRRSLDLNFENNILLYSAETARKIRQRQADWLADCNEISAQSVTNRRPLRRIAKNLATIFSPIM